MAEVIAEWPSIVRTRSAKYPWAEWSDGQIWKVAEGEDFESNLKTFVQGLYAFAKRHSMKVEARTDVPNSTVAFRFITGPQSVTAEAGVTDAEVV